MSEGYTCGRCWHPAVQHANARRGTIKRQKAHMHDEYCSDCAWCAQVKAERGSDCAWCAQLKTEREQCSADGCTEKGICTITVSGLGMAEAKSPWCQQHYDAIQEWMRAKSAEQKGRR